MDLSYIVLCLTAILTVFYWYFIRPLNYWKKQGIASAPNAIPVFGHALSVLLIRENVSTVCNKLYNSCCEKAGMMGMFMLRTPGLIISDLELIKCVLIKDFNSFENNMIVLDEKADPFMSKNPFFSIGETWKVERKQLVSNMSQKKLKILFQNLHEVTFKLDDYLDKTVKDNEMTEFECKDVCLKFTADAVANTVFGLEGHSFDNNQLNFNIQIQSLFISSLLSSIREILNFYLPKLGSIFKIGLMPATLNVFLKDALKKVLHYRIKNGVSANDFLQLTIDSVEELNEDVIYGHLSGFFFDAYETAANVAAAACYRLSTCPEVQERLREEILETLDKYDNTLTYEALKDMTYLDQVINETIRLHPIMGVSAKTCTKKITLEGSNGQKCCLEPGNFVFIPVLSLHTDDKFWKDPSVFDPDRFSEERKHEITKFTYLPFGEGPRMCAGMRYGIMTVKTILSTILRKYIIKSSDKMEPVLKVNQSMFLNTIEGGIWAKLERIDTRQ